MISNSELRNRNSELNIILIMSTSEELRPFLGTVRHRRTVFAGLPAWNFRGPGYTGMSFLVGMGGSVPRRLADRAIAAYAPACVCVAGFGGALTPQPPPGGLLIADQCWLLTPEGFLNRMAFSPPAPPSALAALLRAGGLAASAGALVTTPGMVTKASLPDQVFHLPQPVLDLETAAVALAAQSRRLPLLAVRAITDAAGEEIHPFLADIINRHRGVPFLRLLPALCADPRRLSYCFHLWRRSRLAGSNLAQALTAILGHLTHPQPFLTQNQTQNSELRTQNCADTSAPPPKRPLEGK